MGGKTKGVKGPFRGAIFTYFIKVGSRECSGTVVRVSQHFFGTLIAADLLEQYCSTLTIKQRVMN